MSNQSEVREGARGAMTHRVDVGGVALHVEEQGAGPVVLFGHSLLCDGTMFAAQVADIARDHRVLNLEFRGHGRSGVPPGPYSMEDQAEDYRRVMDALGVERAAVVGLSMGGMAAMRLAIAHPERVAALVLMNTSAGAETRWHRLKYGALAEVFARIGPRDLIVAEATKAMFGRTFRREQAARVQEWTRVLKGLDRRGGQLAVHMVRTRTDVHAQLPRITAPTLVIAGEEDTSTPPSRAWRLAEGIPGAHLEVLPATGHLSTIERPEATTRLIREFLSPASPW